MQPIPRLSGFGKPLYVLCATPICDPKHAIFLFPAIRGRPCLHYQCPFATRVHRMLFALALDWSITPSSRLLQ